MSELPWTSRTARSFVRLMSGGASDSIPDRQGRVLIPQNLRDYAGLTAEAVIVGVNNKLEIWNPDRLAAEKALIESDPDKFAENLSQLGI